MHHTNRLKVFIVFLSVFIIISFVPCALNNGNISDQQSSNFENAVLNGSYNHWLLTILIACAPLIIDSDLSNSKTKLSMKSNFDFQPVLIFFLVIPNLVVYLLQYYTNARTDFHFLAMLEKSIFLTQLSGIVGTFLYFFSMSNICQVPINNETLDTPVGNLNILQLSFLIAFQIFEFSSNLNTVGIAESSSSRQICFTLSTLCLILALLVHLYVSYHSLLFLRKQRNSEYKFKNSSHMILFYRILIVDFIFVYMVVFYISTSSGDLNCFMSNITSEYLSVCAYCQIAVAFSWLLINIKCAKREAEIQCEKLEVRLNLVRYISHEMRTPLNTSCMGLQLLTKDASQIENTVAKVISHNRRRLRDDVFTNNKVNAKELALQCQPLVEQILDTTSLIEEATNAAVQTLDDMLIFDKLDERKLVVEMGETPPLQIVRDAMRPFELRARAQEISLVLKCNDETALKLANSFIKVDRFKISQVMRNLLSNACKFVPPHSGWIRVVVEERASPAKAGSLVSVLRVSVVDNGCGISKENQKRMFGQYVQFNAGALQEGKGSGLGLWISRSLIELHGGRIGVESEGEGHGTTFFFELPLYSAASSSTNSLAFPSLSGHNFSQSSDLVGMGSSSSASGRTFGDRAASAAAAVAAACVTIKPSFGSSRVVPYDIESRGNNYVPEMESFPETGESAGDEGIDSSSRPSVLSFMHWLPPSVYGQSSAAAASSTSSSSVMDLSVGTSGAVGGKKRGGFMKSSVIIQDVSLPPFSEHEDNDDDLLERIAWIRDSLTSSQGSAKLRRISTDSPLSAAQSPKASAGLAAAGVRSRLSEEKKVEKKLRILIVDDSASSRKVTNKLLTRLGHIVEEASDGMQFLAIMGLSDSFAMESTGDGKGDPVISTFPQYDVILMDDNMPYLSGPAATAIVRRFGYKGLIFGVTGNTSAQDVGYFMAQGADRVLPKPLDLGFLAFCTDRDLGAP